MPEPAATDTVVWGLSWANVISFFGIAVTFALGILNYIKNNTTRRNAIGLSAFGAQVRAPVEKALTDLEAVMDKADDIVRSSQSFSEKQGEVVLLNQKFHAARRILARLFTDCDASPIVDGKNWSLIEETDMDEASESLDYAGRSVDDVELRDRLHQLAICINRLRQRVRLRLDEHAKRLMQ